MPVAAPEVLILYRRTRPLRLTADNAVAAILDMNRTCPDRAALCAAAAQGVVRLVLAEAGAALLSPVIAAGSVPTVVIVEDYRRGKERRPAGWLISAREVMARAVAVVIDTAGSSDQISLLTERAVAAGPGTVAIVVATDAAGWQAWDHLAGEARTEGSPTVLVLPARYNAPTSDTIH